MPVASNCIFRQDPPPLPVINRNPAPSRTNTAEPQTAIRPTTCNPSPVRHNDANSARVADSKTFSPSHDDGE
jgi:hypothetical protein